MQDLKNVLIENYSLKHFCVMIYEILFIDSTSFNFEDFKNKSNAFELVLNVLNDDLSRIDEEGKYVREVLEEKQVWASFIKYIYEKFPGFTLIFCLFVKYFKNNEQIIRFLIDLIQAIKSYTIEVKFNLKDLNNMNENNIAQDFLNILDNADYFKLVYENEHIIAELLSEEEKAKVLEEIEVNKFLNEINEDLIREKPNILNERKSENQEIKNDSKSKTKNKNKIIEAPKKEDENKHKNNKDEKQLNQDKEEVNDNKSIIEQIQKLQLEMSKIKKKNETQEDIIKNMNNRIEEQNNRIEEQNNRIEEQNNRIEEQNNMIKGLKKENKLQNNTILRNKQNQIKSQQIIRDTYHEFSKRLSDVESDLNMIKSRDAVKSFINYFYNGFRLNGDYDYRDKAAKILEKLNKYNDFNKYDPILGNTLRCLLRKGAEKIYKGNDLAHEINSSEEWLFQLFNTIEPNMKYGNIVKKLLEEKADNLIMESINIRHKNYKDRAKLEELEKTNYSKVSEENIRTILMK